MFIDKSIIDRMLLMVIISALLIAKIVFSITSRKLFFDERYLFYTKNQSEDYFYNLK